MPRLEPESTVSHYRIKELIASGGMGEVYRAIDLQLGRVVALKTILPVKADDRDAHRRFLREARSASILSHPSICTVYEIAQEGNLTFIAMQYVAGRTLQEILSKEQLPIETVLSYALDITDALDEAHRNGVVHRDIKPSNIIANERDIAVVLDFGLAKQVSFAGALNEDMSTLANLTSAATLLGTAAYMPPEEIRGVSLDERSDIFSLGVTLYEMLSGVRPFDRPNKVELLHAILHDEPQPISELRPDVDFRLSEIVGKALKKDRGDRYQSAREFKEEILRYVQESGYRVRGVSSTSARGGLTQVSTDALGKLGAKIRFMTPAIFWSALALFSLILVGTVWWIVVNRDSRAQPVLRHVQLVNWKSEPGELDSDAVFSRDGRMIAFSSIRGGHRDIWIKQTALGDANQISKGEWNSRNPIWSPDNQEIAFVSKRGEQTGIWRTPAVAGTPVQIGALASASIQLKSWSKDGATIFYESYPNLFALDVASGKAKQVTKFDPSQHFGDLNLSMSPDEERVAYVDRIGGRPNIWVMPMRGGSPVQVTNDSADDMHPVWHPDGQRIIYSSIRDGTYQICVAYLNGREPEQITSGENDKFVLDVSGDGAKILYGASKEESDLWGVKIANGEEFETTSDAGVEVWPDISPDGKTVAYQSISDPGLGEKLNESLIVTKPTGRESQQTQLAAGGVYPKWSPDGRRLSFLRRSGDTWNIYTVGAAGGDEKQLTTRGVPFASSGLPYNRIPTDFYSWSPDGRKIVYPSQTPSESSLWVVSADSSGETSISSKTGLRLYCPLWSSDGHHIAYVSQTEVKSPGGELTWSVWLADVRTKTAELIFQSGSVLQLLGWSASGKDLIIGTIEGKDRIWQTTADVALIQVSTSGAGNRVIARVKSAYMLNTQLSPDGLTIACASHQDGKDNLWVIPRKGEARKITSNSDPRLYFSTMAFSPDGKFIYFGKQSRSSLVWMIDNFK